MVFFFQLGDCISPIPPTYLGEPETTIDCTMVNYRVFSSTWENMVLLSLEEAPPFLPAKRIHFLLAMMRPMVVFLRPCQAQKEKPVG